MATTVNLNGGISVGSSNADVCCFLPTGLVSLYSSVIFKFPGPVAGSPIKLRFVPTTTATTTATLDIGTTLYNTPYNSQTISNYTHTANVWNEITLNAAQVTMVGANSTFYVQLSFYSSPDIYAAGGNAIHLYVPDMGSIRVNVGGTWKLGIPYTNIGGAWKQGTAYVNIGGAWKTGI